MDKLQLHGLSFYAHHGLFEEEAKLGQRFVVDMTCWADLSKPSLSDAYEDTICYGKLAKTVEAVVTQQRFNLLERLGGAICEAVFAADHRIARISVTINKPGAPVPVHAGGFSVQINRERA
ncbi:dihydroneopterin aldolase [Polycladidibacter stylochi]|uniref:dihydroneopterin aldolase n=1 Tax=Polycladidibacter stylochi TaxID=1807766 RepID=UPI000830CB21|nr:dihydroneopterin aldolase [Pseudovibrio stylochi]